MSDYLNELNEGQRAAVLYNDGPSLVIAGAGSGKTRVLTYKIAWLLENGYQPWNILALTFTNKAAREMKERIARQVGDGKAHRLWMGTFHSIFLRILHTEAAKLGFTPQFTIYDAADSKSLLRAIIKEMQLDEKAYKPGVVQARISNAKNHLVTPAGYAANREAYEGDCAAKMPAIRDIYRRYWDRCRQADAMDFDDLLIYTYILFRDHPEVLARYQEQFRYILVDEYQDTNFAQHSIVLQLAQGHRHVCVVGDDAQSIYSFRGADIDNILYFTKVYPDTKVFKLEQNYRSTQTIVSAANSLIEKNQRQIRKEVFSEKEKGDPIDVFQAYSDVEEGDIVTNKIKQLRQRGPYAWADFAILYRTNAQSRIFEEALRKRSMPYRIYGGLSFYQRKEIKDVIAYFRLVINPHDEEAFKRIINYPARGIGDTTVGKITSAATEHGTSLWTVLCEPLSYGLKLNKGTAGKLQGFKELIAGFLENSAQKNAYEAGMEIIQASGIARDVTQDNSPENLSRKENVDELLNGMSDFCAQRLEEGLFPSEMSGNSPRVLEEERRLFYVAITRAEEHCFLSYAKTRFRYGKTEFCRPSRFLQDIDVRFLHLPQEAIARRQVDEAARNFRSNFHVTTSFPPESRQRPLRRIETGSTLGTLGRAASASPSAASHDLSAGQHIEHERFGIGEVLRVEGEGDNAKATIRFRNAGEKQLLLRFARFKIID